MPTEAASASAVALAIDTVFAVDSHSENGHDAASPGSDGLDDEGQRARGEDGSESAAVMVDADGADAPVVVGGTVAVGIAIEPPRDEGHLSAADRPVSYNSVQAARRLQSGATRGPCAMCAARTSGGTWTSGSIAWYMRSPEKQKWLLEGASDLGIPRPLRRSMPPEEDCAVCHSVGGRYLFSGFPDGSLRSWGWGRPADFVAYCH